jgi:hypothetical protein
MTLLNEIAKTDPMAVFSDQPIERDNLRNEFGSSFEISAIFVRF